MNTQQNTAELAARAQVASIVAMVAALNVDYDQLGYLREERDDFAADYTPDYMGRKAWAEKNPEEAEELAELEEAANGCESEDQARERIYEDALSVEVRSGWASPGEDLDPEEFRIVLCTGGPHVEILGEFDIDNEPNSVRICYRGWSESGELFDFDQETVLTYCKQFFPGE